MLSALEEENRKAIQSRRPAASATYYKGPGVISSMPQKDAFQYSSGAHLESIAERQGKAVSNPFSSRPISQMLPKRTTDNQKYKTMH